jgi:hypothetical protein
MKLAFVVITAGLAVSFAARADETFCSRHLRPYCVLKGATRTTVLLHCPSGAAGRKILHEGRCEGGDMCSMLYKPVCAINPATGKEETYSGICVSEHANARITHDGACTAP